MGPDADFVCFSSACGLGNSTKSCHTWTRSVFANRFRSPFATALSIPDAIGRMVDTLKEMGSGIVDFLLAPIRLAFEGLQQIPGFDKLMQAIGNFGGARASGGPVSSGSTYLVGEQGPELFTPSRSGSISPNGAGGVTIGALVGSLVLNVSGSAEAGANLIWSGESPIH